MTKPTSTSRIAVTMPRLSQYGGAESFAWRLSAALAQRGHDVDFICGRCEGDAPEGVNPVVVGRFGGTRLIKLLWFTFMCARKQKQGGYDLVFGMANSPDQDILRIGGGPISVFWQLSKQAWPAGAARSFKMLRRRLNPTNWVMHKLDNLRMRRTKKVVAVSHFVRELILQAHPYRTPESIEVIYNRPDLSKFSRPTDEQRAALRQQAGIEQGRVVIGTAATNFALKGVRQLITALADLPEHFELHIAGGRRPDKYIRLAQKLGVEDRVRFLGKVDDMASFYRRIDIFILATFYDACSNAVLEALACGCRVASSARNGSAYFLPDTHVFPDPADVAAMAALLRKMEKEERPVEFQWPSDVPSGIDPFISIIESMVSK